MSNKRKKKTVKKKKEETVFDKLKIETADMLYMRGAIDLTGYHELKHHEEDQDAPLSPIYLNFRDRHNPKRGPLLDADLDLFAHCFLRLMWENNIVFSALTGLPRSGAAIIAALERIMPAPRGFRIVSMAKEEHGKERRIVRAPGCHYRRGESVLLLDDVFSRGKSKEEAIRLVEEDGAKVAGIAVMADRLQGGSAKLERAGYKVYAVFTVMYLLAHGLRQGRISRAKYRECAAYLENERKRNALRQ